MNARLIVLSAVLFPLLPACTVVHTAVAKSNANESFDCAAGALNDMGYSILYADKDLGVIRAERSKPPQSTLLARNNGDRIVVVVTPVHDDTSRMVARGETIFVLPSSARPLRDRQAGFGGDSGAIAFLSPEVRADTRAVLTACANKD